ncbi:MAG: hypothetical protein KDD69_18610 [Bdellovibrionales bacterium]|nr:hypothetical protein [Bdellovibrionales bacterium]
MAYRCEAVSIDGLVQQIAVSYLRHGYLYYVTGMLPDGKDPHALDAKLIDRYGIAISERERARRKLSGLANMQYIRHGQFFVLLCTEGRHVFREIERDVIRDAREVPIRIPKEARARCKKHYASGPKNFEGYAVSYRRGHYQRKTAEEKSQYREERASGLRPPRGTKDEQWRSRVEIERRTYKRLRAYFLNIAGQHSVEHLARELQAIPYQPYAPIRQQLLGLVRDINVVRRVAGRKDEVPYEALNLKRLQIQPFVSSGSVERDEAANSGA